MGVDTSRWSHLADFVGHSNDALSGFFLLSCSPITLLRYADKSIVSVMKLYIERNNLERIFEK